MFPKVILKVIQISIDEDDDAYEIFERINNYGVDLTLADLLKNHVLKNLQYRPCGCV